MYSSNIKITAADKTILSFSVRLKRHIACCVVVIRHPICNIFFFNTKVVLFTKTVFYLFTSINVFLINRYLCGIGITIYRSLLLVIDWYTYSSCYLFQKTILLSNLQTDFGNITITGLVQTNQGIVEQRRLQIQLR